MDQTSQTNNEIYEGSDLEALSTMRRYQEWIISQFQPYLAGDAIEIGAGIGNIASHILPHVSTLKLVEPSENMIGRLREKFTDTDNVTIIQQEFDTLVRDTPAGSYDCVILVNVLEHIEDDSTAVSECMRILRPNGHLLVLVPALPFLFSDLDAAVGHYRRYTKDGLSSTFESASFSIELHSYFDFLGIFPWWVLNTLGGAIKFNPKLVNVYDLVFVPITRWLEERINPPVGKNLITVGKRTEA